MIATMDKQEERNVHPVTQARGSLSYRAAAPIVGLTYRRLWSLEQGLHIPHPTTAARIASAFPEHFATPNEVRERCKAWQRLSHGDAK